MAYSSPVTSRDQALRNLGYTGLFGAGGGDAWLAQNNISTKQLQDAIDRLSAAAAPAPVAAPAAPAFNHAANVALATKYGYSGGDQGATGEIQRWLDSQANPQQLLQYGQERKRYDPGYDERTPVLKALGFAGAAGTGGQYLIDNFGLDDLPRIINNPEWALQQATDIEIAKQKADPTYGQLAKPPFKDFKPFALSDYIADPGYQFRKDEGNKAINAAQAARGNFYSGKALKEADKYNSDLASQEYGAAYNRYNQDFNTGYTQKANDSNTLYNRLAGVVNTGTGATNTGVNLNTNYANSLGNIYGQAGNAQAANSLYQGNNFSNILGGLTNVGQSQYGSGGGKTIPGFTNKYGNWVG